MAEYRDREALLNRVETLTNRITPIEENRDMFYHDSGWNGAIVGMRIEIEKIPAADVVEVCRCRDCKWTDNVFKNKVIWCDHDERWVEEDNFCKYGSRRESNDKI